MKTVNIHEAKTHFSRLINEAGSGEEIIIAKSGKPVARLIPVEKKSAKRLPGSAKGKISLSADFMEPLSDDLLETFEK